MKTKLLLLLAMCIGMTSSAWALEKDGDVYQISSAQDLADFAALVNGGETTANAVLTGDIDMSKLQSWTAIGDWNTGAVSSAYCGHFDGKGYTINNFNFTSNKNYFAIFGVISTGCLIENFSIEGTITNASYQYAGGVAAYARDATPTIRNVKSYVIINNSFVTEKASARIGGILGGSLNGTVVVENCSYFGTLNAGELTGNFGGIVGYVNNNTKANLTICNCLFKGTLENGSADGQCGGIAGYIGANPIVNIKNCLSIGSVTSKELGMIGGRVTGANVVYTNNYYKSGSVNANGSQSRNDLTATKVDDNQLKSGEICFDLNDKQSKNVSWFQKLPSDENNYYPTPYGTDVVFINGTFCPDTGAPQGSFTYSNTEGTNIGEHKYTDGLCTYCSFPDKNYMTANTDGYFEIGTVKQLKWFSAYVNQINPKVNAVLTGDINLAGEAWTPMCGGSGNVAPGETAYAGTFDGQGHSITGFNAEGVGHLGLFSDANNANIKNFSISGSLKVTGGYCGGVVANLTNCIIENVHSALIIDVPNSETHHVGGVVGTARGGNIIKRCSFDGSMTVASGSTDNSAGIAAYITNGDKVIDCVNYGDVTFKDINCAAGGIVGYVNAQEAYVQNCLTIGKILFDGEGAPKYGGAILGRTKGFSAEKVTNNYWLEGSAYGSAKKNDGSDPKVAPSVTTEQLASGEVTAKLGIAFRQNLEDEGESKKDPYPVIPMSYEDLLEHDVVVKISEAGYATLYIPDVDVVADEIKAFTGEINGEKLKLIPVKDKTSGVCFIPAQTAVILKGAPGIYSLIPGFGAAKIEGNVLKGSAEDTEAAGKYVLAKPENAEVGFYLANAGTIKAGKAYLELPSTEVKAFYFGGENETAIVSPLGETKEGVAVYNLAGQRINKLQKGINIVGGKKVLK